MELLENTTDKRRLFGRWFARRIITYVAVCAFLTFVNWYTSPHYWWVVWVMAGWGLNLILLLPVLLCLEYGGAQTRNGQDIWHQ